MRGLLASALIALALAAAAAPADIVYMRSGKQYVGKVTKQGDGLKIEMDLGTIVVKESDTIYVAYGTGTTQPTATAASSGHFRATRTR